MLYTLIFYLIYLSHSFARRIWRREIEKRERRTEGWRGRFAQKENEKVRFPIWLWLESRKGPRLCPDSTKIQRFRWSWQSILRFGSWNLVKFHDCPKKIFSAASLRLIFSPSSRCALHCWTLFEVDSSVLQRHLAKTKWGAGEGYSSRHLDMLSDNCVLNAFSVNSNIANPPPGKYLHSTLDHSFFLIIATWLLPCLTHSHIPPCVSECVYMRVWVGCVCGPVGTRVCV